VPLPDSWGFRGFTAVFAITFGTTGALIVAARRNLVGWLLLVGGALSGVQCLCEEYAIYGVVAHPGSLPAAAILGWINSWIWVGIVALVGIFVPLWFPTGHFLSPRWRVAGIATVAAAVFLGTALALQDGPLNNAPFVENPFGVQGFKVLDVSTGTPGPVFLIGYGALVSCALAAIGSVVARFRAARGIERQQLKTLAFGGGILVLGFLAGAGLQQQGKVGQLFFISALQVVPFAVAVAVLRYRLYDIDVLINRALVYGATTGAIAIAFFAGIVILQAALRPITGGSELAVAASTLVCFALFQPIRRAVQSTVDRRFYRSRYDASQTLDLFVSRLAGEVDLDAIGAELGNAVGVTMRPSHVSLWLRDRELGQSRNDARTPRG
jgi:hypothetical protein